MRVRGTRGKSASAARRGGRASSSAWHGGARQQQRKRKTHNKENGDVAQKFCYRHAVRFGEQFGQRRGVEVDRGNGVGVGVGDGGGVGSIEVMHQGGCRGGTPGQRHRNGAAHHGRCRDGAPGLRRRGRDRSAMERNGSQRSRSRQWRRRCWRDRESRLGEGQGGVAHQAPRRVPRRESGRAAAGARSRERPGGAQVAPAGRRGAAGAPIALIWRIHRPKTFIHFYNREKQRFYITVANI